MGQSHAPLGLEAPRDNPRFPLMDPLRGVAAAMVFLFHFAAHGTRVGGVAGKLLDHGDCGVALFFLISGFLLYRPFVTAHDGGRPHPTARRFWARRLLRIVPAYWVALTLLAIYPGLTDFDTHWWALYPFGQIYDQYLRFSGISAAWSLCVEVSFYAVLPLFALAMRTLLRRVSAHWRWQAEFAVLAALSVASLIFNRILKSDTAIYNLEFTLPGTFYLFSAGMAIAVASCHWQGTAIPGLIRRHATHVWLAAAAFYVAVSLTIPSRSLGSVNPIWEVLAILILLPATVGTDHGLARVLAWRPLVGLGVISYAFYLWHDNLISLLAEHIHQRGWLFCAALAAALLIATLSYHLVEAPFLRIKLRVGVNDVAPGVDAGGDGTALVGLRLEQTAEEAEDAPVAAEQAPEGAAQQPAGVAGGGGAG